MKRMVFSVVALILIRFSTIGVVPAQLSTERIYLRSSIEKYPPAERQPLLKYLNDQRPIADKAMKLVAEGKADALYALLSSEARKEVTIDQLRALLLRWEQSAGTIASYGYRSQAFLAPNDGSTTLELDKAKSQVWYAVKGTKRGDGGLFMIIKTSSEGGKNVVSLIQFLTYGDKIPPWLRLPSTETP